MSNTFRRVPFSPEMNPFQGEVCRDQSFVPGCGLQDRAVIADRCHNSRTGVRALTRDLCLAPYSFDNLELVEGQSLNTIEEPGSK